MARILLADDDAATRDLVQRALALDGHAVVVTQDGAEALETLLAAPGEFDLLITDVQMPGLDGITATQQLVAEIPEIRVLILTTFELDDYVFEALRGGASGFLIKDGEPAELLHAIRVVADGGSLLASSVTRKLIEEFASQQPNRTVPHPRLDSLTAREREIVSWVATGRSNDEIAAELVVSPATVRTHVGRAMSKLGARDRAQLVVFAYQSGLAP